MKAARVVVVLWVAFLSEAHPVFADGGTLRRTLRPEPVLKNSE